MNKEINAEVHVTMPWVTGGPHGREAILFKSATARGRHRGRATLFYKQIIEAKRKGEKVTSKYMQKYR